LVKKRLGLRPIALHLDNGWDTEMAVKNIENMVKKLDIDLYTHVLDWEEFKDIQLSYLKASVLNIEAPTDQAISALLLRTAVKKKIKYIFLGGNIKTESIMADSWRYDYKDIRNIKSIYKRYGTGRMENFIHLSLFHWFFFTIVCGVRIINILNYFPYNKKEAMKTLEKELQWKPYDAKHHESLYTRFFQSYYLPEKFNIDKRKAYLSALICSGELSRDEALEEIRKEPCPPEVLADDVDYVRKKLGVSKKEFENIMAAPARSHCDFPHSRFLRNKGRYFQKIKKIIMKQQ
jgi:hypothetical protein